MLPPPRRLTAVPPSSVEAHRAPWRLGSTCPRSSGELGLVQRGRRVRSHVQARVRVMGTHRVHTMNSALHLLFEKVCGARTQDCGDSVHRYA